jgi:hypothetical protein
VQSAFVVHTATHAPEPGELVRGAQAIPLGQSAFLVQPHIAIGPGPGPGAGPTIWQTLPPAPLVQSALVMQPHATPMHTEPFPLAAQSVPVTQPTHRPVVVLQAGPPALPVQSALEAHARMHAPLEPAAGTRPPVAVAHTKPAGQSAFDEQPHAAGEQPHEQLVIPSPSHT